MFNVNIIFYYNLLLIIAFTTANLLQSGYDYSIKTDIKKLPTPEEVVLYLSEDEFEDYLDFWTYQKNFNDIQDENAGTESKELVECAVPIYNLKEPLPVYIINNALIEANGTSGNIILSDAISAGCTGSGLYHSSSTTYPSTGILTCNSGESVMTSWIPHEVNFTDVTCIKHPIYLTVERNVSCLGDGVLIDSILTLGSDEYVVLSSCFHKESAQVFYVEYELKPENRYFQPSVKRPSFLQGTHFPGLGVNTLYTQISQKMAFDTILGSSMNLKYLNSSFFLSRGHLAAKSDKVLAPEQRATFTFVNTVPQWQPFNGGNWNTLEQNLRARIATAGYRATIYTGAHGILNLADSNGVYKDIYLSSKTQQIPVPMWLYKVVYEQATQRGVVFLGLNNPHVSLEEAKQLAFCFDICANNTQFSWLNWKPEDIGLGYSICCEVDDFRRSVAVLPTFVTNGILS